MSVKGEITTDMYRQMMDLQEKLRQSEAERTRLEEMFTVLVKTFREEEDTRLKSLENRYHIFLEDCARRSYRNEKILRSVERVESGVNALHAKTERLKLLRSHYEAYLERVIPTWRQPALLRYGPGAIQTAQGVEWGRCSRLIPEENIELDHDNFLPYGSPSRHGRTYGTNLLTKPDNFSSRHSDGEKQVEVLPSGRNPFDKSYSNSTTSGSEGKVKHTYGYDRAKSFQGGVDIQHLESRNNIQSKTFRGYFDNEFMDDGRLAVKGLEPALHRKLALGSRPDPPRDLLYVEGAHKDGLEALHPKAQDVIGRPNETFHTRSKVITSPVHKEQDYFVGGGKDASPSAVGVFDKSFIDVTPRITREPVEIRKPEIIVGKHHPEATFKVDNFKNRSNFEGSPVVNVESENILKPVPDPILSRNGKKVESEKVRTDVEVRQANPHAKWGLLKHMRTIDKLKETLSLEEAQELKVVEEKTESENLENLSVEKTSFERLRKESDETAGSQSSSEGWKPTVEQIMSQGFASQAGAASDKEARPRNGMKECSADEENVNEFVPTFQENFEELPQKDADNTNEEIYEDNEESYPESYYEQPPKSDYSRDIVSNVILEEDESEVNMHSEIAEGPIQNQENVQGNNGYERTDYHASQEDIQTDYNSYSVDGTAEVNESKNEYQNYKPNEAQQGYQSENVYEANYGNMQHQEEFTYDNQEVNNYNTNNALEYTMEQYPGNGDAHRYYENQQSEHRGNYASEGMGQDENFDNAYSQIQNYESNSAVEQYSEDNGTYQQVYDQGQNANYYNQGEYDRYYQSQQEHSGEYPGNNEAENMGYSEGTAYENMQGHANSYGDGSNNLPLRQSNLSHLLESDSESFQMEHGSAAGNEDSDFDFSMSQQQ